MAQPFARPDDLDVGRLLRDITAYTARCVALNPRVRPQQEGPFRGAGARGRAQLVRPYGWPVR